MTPATFVSTVLLQDTRDMAALTHDQETNSYGLRDPDEFLLIRL